MRRLILNMAALLAVASCMFAQEYRATITGSITDSSGASVPGARIGAINKETGVSVSSVSNAQGRYVIPYLLPGQYNVRVEHAGFKSFERGSIELRIADRFEVNARLEVGLVSDQVTVTGIAPLLESATGSGGQVIDNRKITDLPLNGHNPIELVNLATGVSYSGTSLTYFRPFDNGTINDFSINGGQRSMNEIQLDGVPNNAYTYYSNLQQVAYIPPVEATQEFKVQTNSYDAQYGRTGGGVISLSVKPGTNRLHGAAYEYLRRTDLTANTYANNANKQVRPPRVADQYGFEIDGPVVLPKLYRGRDKTFFMLSFEKYREVQPQPGLGAVPTPEQRSGDFSQTFTAANRLYTIYDPLTVSNGGGTRQPFADNRVPAARFNQVALNVLKDIPLPNQAGDPITHLNNWFAGDANSATDYYNGIARVDQNFGDRVRFYSRWNRNFRDGGKKNAYSWDTNAKQFSHSARNNDGGVVDVVDTLNPRTVLSARFGFNRYVYSSIYSYQDLSYLGIPVTSQLQTPGKYPLFKWENYIGTSVEDNDYSPSENWTAQASLLKVTGSHSLKFGGEYRVVRYADLGVQNGGGSYSFTRGWTNASALTDNASTGNAIASFLLGYMASAQATLNATPYLTWRYPVVYFQDDWKVHRRLTLNLGLRWDYEAPVIERYNRQERGFDLTARSPIAAPGYNLQGGLLFAAQNGLPRGAFEPTRNAWQPRVGVAYKISDRRPLVFRGGIGRYYLPTTDNGGFLGFSAVTTAQTTTADFLPFNTLSNPFPSGLIQPTGSKLGLATQAGNAITFSDPTRRVPYVWQFSAGFQYEITPGLLLDASYVGSRTRDLQVSRDINQLTAEQLALGTTYLNQSQPNPFFGVLPANTSRGATATTQRRNLLVPYPQFTSVTENAQSLGKSWYNSMQIKLEKRLAQGLSILVSYTASKNMEALAYLNPQDKQLSRELVAYDVPQRLAFSGVYEFPIGPHKKWLNHGVASHVIGGWSFNWTAIAQPGQPITYSGSYYIFGDPKLSGGQNLNHWFNTSPSIWVVRPPDTLRTAKMRSSTIRSDSKPQYDATLIRNFRIREGQRIQFKVSAFNLTNTPIFGPPNTTPSSALFGVVPVTQINLPRDVELGFRYSF
jgi:Carboxypeptidase regulatory-like domain